MRKISLCITNFNRTALLFESYKNVVDDERISEIIISDDASDIDLFNEVKLEIEKHPKIKLYRNLINQDCYYNKYTAVSLATNEWVILLDSDNVINKSYIDCLFEIKKWDNDTSYMPSWAMPLFDYRAYNGLRFTKENIASYIDKHMVSTCLNCANYFVNREEYMSAFDPNVNPHTADSIFINYNLLNNGNAIEIVPDLVYEHRVHNGSHYQNNHHKTGNLYDEILNKIRLLK